MAKRYLRKPEGSYHHPDLESALVNAAVRVIREKGVEALTLRGVGELLGVSRTALYRHFEDKSALLARVALEGFRRFRVALMTAVQSAREQGQDPMEEMGAAYIEFALANPSHYLTMFGGVVLDWPGNPDLVTEADGAFQVLVDTIVEEQKAGHIAAQDPQPLAQVVWANVHGIASLTINGQFETGQHEALGRYSWKIMRAGLRRK